MVKTKVMGKETPRGESKQMVNPSHRNDGHGGASMNSMHKQDHTEQKRGPAGEGHKSGTGARC